MTFMLHATHDDDLCKILAEGLKPRVKIDTNTPQHAHMACLDHVIRYDDPSTSALQPAGRDATQGFYNIKISGERAVLTDQSIDPQNIIAAYSSSGKRVQLDPASKHSSKKTWIRKPPRSMNSPNTSSTRSVSDRWRRRISRTRRRGDI